MNEHFIHALFKQRLSERMGNTYFLFNVGRCNYFCDVKRINQLISYQGGYSMNKPDFLPGVTRS